MFQKKIDSINNILIEIVGSDGGDSSAVRVEESFCWRLPVWTEEPGGASLIQSELNGDVNQSEHNQKE